MKITIWYIKGHDDHTTTELEDVGMNPQHWIDQVRKNGGIFVDEGDALTFVPWYRINHFEFGR